MTHTSFDRNFFIDLPKAELHCHLDGSLRIETLIDLAQKENFALPSFDPNALKEKVGFGKRHKDLNDYLDMFDFSLAVMQDKESLYRIAFELVEDAAKENIWHLEIRYCPTYLCKKGLKIKEVVTAINDGAEAAAKKYQVSVKMILCAIRTLSEAENLDIVNAAIEFQTAMDLAGPENVFSNHNYKKVFDLAQANNLDITIHAGEDFDYKNIADAITDCHAQRIGHGTHLYQNEKLLREIIEKQIPLEVCLASNYQTHSAESLKDHPAKKYIKQGVNITLNTDNRLMSDTSLSKEYETAYKNFQLSFEDIKKLVLNGFEASFLPEAEKNAMIKKVKEKLRQPLK